MYTKIKQLCDERGITIRRLEKELELSNGSISKWDKSIPRADTLLKVANYFDVSITYLLKEE